MTHKRRDTDVPFQSVIPEGVTVTGKIEGSINILINGRFRGDLHLNGVILVGEHGEVEGEVRAKVIAIDGRLDGHVFASQKVEIGASARVKADIHCPVFVMAEKSVFEGSIFSESGNELQPVMFQDRRERRTPVEASDDEE